MSRARRLGVGLLLVLGTSAHLAHAQDANHPHGHLHPPAEGAAQDETAFVAKRIEKTATITLHGDIDSVWPLFDPINESKWASVWKPEILHPGTGVVEEGMVFRTHGTVWVVTRYDTNSHHITYTVYHPEKVHTIDVRCTKHAAQLTDATVTYAFVGLTERGNELIEGSANRLFANNLKDWQKLINHYLETGETLPLDQIHGPAPQEKQGKGRIRRGEPVEHCFVKSFSFR